MRKANYLKRTTKGAKITFLLVGIFFFLYAMTYVFTFGWAFINSLKEKIEFIRDPMAWPKTLHFENYVEAFKVLEVDGHNLFQLILNSLWYAGGIAFISTMTTNIAAYCCSKYDWKFGKIYYRIALFTMLVSIGGSLPATYQILAALEMLDSPLYLLTSASALGFNFILLYSFYKNVSWEYAEAVFVDGGNHYTVFFKVMLPQSLPMCLALGIITFISGWNDCMTPLLFLRNYPTLASGLYLFQYVPEIRSNYPLYFAAILMAIVPVVILYASFQDTIMKNTVAGGLKG